MREQLSKGIIMFDENRILIPNLIEVGGKMRGTASFVKDEAEKIVKDVRSRLFGPTRSDFEKLTYLVTVLADELEERGKTVYQYHRWLDEKGLVERFPTIEKTEYDI